MVLVNPLRGRKTRPNQTLKHYLATKAVLRMRMRRGQKLDWEAKEQLRVSRETTHCQHGWRRTLSKELPNLRSGEEMVFQHSTVILEHSGSLAGQIFLSSSHLQHLYLLLCTTMICFYGILKHFFHMGCPVWTARPGFTDMVILKSLVDVWISRGLSG